MTKETVPCSFDSFGFNKEIMKGISTAGFKVPSPVQEQVMPLILEGRDVIAQSHTGTGKTAAFGLPAMNSMQKSIGIELLVITPTRELAAQISDEIFRLGKFAGIRTCTILGGHSYSRQLRQLESGVQVLSATPGRLLDMLKSGKIALTAPLSVVLDEADEMLDMGFLDDIMEIFEFLPQERQTMLFSATMPPQIRRLAGKILDNPEFIKAISTDNSTNVDIDQSYYVIQEQERELAAIRLMEALDPEKAIVFCRTKLEVDKLSTYLGARGYNAKGLHGDMEQPQRNQVMTSFRNGMIDILVATDVAARGLDVADVTHVFNYHIPFDAKSYIHRVGRTGRAGQKGKAVTLVTPSEFRTIQRIEKSVGSTIKLKVIPTISSIREEKRKRLSGEVFEYTPGTDGINLIEALEEEMDVRSIAVILASMLLDADKTTGPDQIGYTEETLRKMLRREKDSYRNRSGSRGRDRGGYRGRRDSRDRDNRDRDNRDRDNRDRDNRKKRSDEKSDSKFDKKPSERSRYFPKKKNDESKNKPDRKDKFSKRSRPKNNRKKND